jgi:hypothetical protein
MLLHIMMTERDQRSAELSPQPTLPANPAPLDFAPLTAAERQRLQDVCLELPEILFECPITHLPIIKPVVAWDGHTYEKSSLTTWLTRHNTSPITYQPLNLATLVSNNTRGKSATSADAKILCCPIGQEIMRDPVIASDGYVYERQNITAHMQASNYPVISWFFNCQPVSPVTGNALPNQNLIPDFATRNIIEAAVNKIREKPRVASYHTRANKHQVMTASAQTTDNATDNEQPRSSKKLRLALKPGA